MTVTETEAFEAMLEHHRNLEQGVALRVEALRQAAPDRDRWGSRAGELIAFMAGEVLPHAVAEEHSIYQAAEAIGTELEVVVAAMVDEHRRLTRSVEGLATAETAEDALRRAEEFAALFSGHVTKENDLILPPLATTPDVNLAGLLAQMHRLTEAAAQETTPADSTSLDTESVLVGLLLEAASGMADAGQGDRACRLAAIAWAALRTPRPDLAVRLTAGLHRLARSVTAEPVTLTSGASRIGAASVEADLDVRPMAPAQRHEKIFAAYGALAPGTGFVLVNDHDPKPLRYQFEAEHPDEHTWEVLEDGPAVWRVRIGKVRPGPAAAG